jgi:uncharacterized ubiquitin-like protein YukD
MISLTPRPFYHRGESFRYPFNIKLLGSQDLFRTFWKTEKCVVRAGIRTQDRPDHSLVIVLTTLSIYFNYSNYSLVFHSVVQITRYSKNHVDLAFSTHYPFDKCIQNHNTCTKLPVTNQNNIHEEVNSTLHVAKLATFQFIMIHVPSLYLNNI